MDAIVGGCLCGAIRYRADAAPLRVTVCHCTHCQKQSGSAFSPVITVPAEALVIEGTTAVFLDRGESGAEVRRRFCATCGSALFSEISTRPGVVIIKAGTLDDPHWLKPEAHIWWRSAQPWIEDLAALPRFEGPFGQPPA